MQDGGAELGRAVIVCVQQDEYASLISRLAGSQLQVAVELLFPVEELVALDENGAQHLGISRGCAALVRNGVWRSKVSSALGLLTTPLMADEELPR